MVVPAFLTTIGMNALGKRVQGDCRRELQQPMRVQSECDSNRPSGVRHINDKRMSGSEIVRDYVTRVWNKRDPTAIPDYIGEPCWRHDAG